MAFEPDDIWIEIFKFLTDAKDMEELGMTNRRLYGIFLLASVQKTYKACITPLKVLGKVVEKMARPGSGLDIRNRAWLKIPIPMSFLGYDLVNWLMKHVNGLKDNEDARKYAKELLRQRLIAHVVSKQTFTFIENCFYVLGERVA